ncbi:MAG: hypothetical protein ABIR24_13275 [Verrucomicrobiota bacterium]
MTLPADSNPVSSFPSTASPFAGGTPLRWISHLLARNPFYILSAALLLYSMKRLSFDSRILPSEVSQLLFNFSSFQVYELLLAFTAIFLARRSIWYDSGLLIGLENLFMFVPFILVSRALMLEGQIAFTFCFTGCGLIVLRLFFLKKLVPSFNVPRGLLCFGAILLAINLGLPLITRLLHRNSNMNIWDSRAAILNGVEWFLIAPLATALLYFLPAPKQNLNREHSPSVFFARGSFPFFALMLWIAGTAAHLYCMGYVYGFAWRLSLLVPSLWLATWIFWKRHADLDIVPEQILKIMERVFLVLPVAVLLVAILSHDWRISVAITLANALIYGILGTKKQDRLAFHLCLISIALAVISLPEAWLSAIQFPILRDQLFRIGLFGYFSSLAVLSRNPKMGILGAIAAPIFFCAIFPKITEMGFHPIFQIAILFVLLHSLRWNDAEQTGTAPARNFAALLWFGNSLWWIISDPLNGGWGTFGSGAFVILVYFATRLIFGFSGPRIILYSALAIAALAPLGAVAQMLRRAPAGLIFLIVSFGLFALGTLAALTKSRWHLEKQIPSTAVERSKTTL